MNRASSLQWKSSCTWLLLLFLTTNNIIDYPCIHGANIKIVHPLEQTYWHTNNTTWRSRGGGGWRAKLTLIYSQMCPLRILQNSPLFTPRCDLFVHYCKFDSISLLGSRDVSSFERWYYGFGGNSATDYSTRPPNEMILMIFWFFKKKIYVLLINLVLHFISPIFIQNANVNKKTYIFLINKYPLTSTVFGGRSRRAVGNAASSETELSAFETTLATISYKN